MSIRSESLRTSISRQIRSFERPSDPAGKPLRVGEYFGSHVFGLDEIRERLSTETAQALMQMVNKGTRLSREAADQTAAVIRDWALSNGATHFCHWFQPMTGLTAEKHDAFISTRASETGQTQVLETFTGASLIQSEPDASSFPSGGMRTTFEARGYTAWDPTSPIFLMQATNGTTMCVPSAFLSYHGSALDTKTPLLRSQDALSKHAVRFLKLMGDVDVKSVTVTLGSEQEYFLVDRAHFSARPDLVMTGRTLLGRGSTRGQQFEDHYFGSISSRILAFMHEVEQELYKLGVPVKTRHNEVAPGQFELAPVFEDANTSADHNSLTMDILCRVALRHDLVCLLHEKPFEGINGSGKHNNWSLSTQSGDNLLDPGKTPHQNVRFLAILTAVLKAVHDHAGVIRAAISSPGNDHRLGANEAPPAIVSVFLGNVLSSILNKIAHGSDLEHSVEEEILSLGVAKIPVIARDNTDRNRTSPFAFTGNKFEFRAVGSSANIAVPVSFLNAAAADSFATLADRLEEKLKHTNVRDEAVLALIKEVILEAEPVLFEGNNYADEWVAEAERRGLPHLRSTPAALKMLGDEKATRFLVEQGVLSIEELAARKNVMTERYVKQIEMEASTALELVETHVFPALEDEIARVSSAVANAASAGATLPGTRLKSMSQLYSRLLNQVDALKAAVKSSSEAHDEVERADLLSQRVIPAMAEMRATADEIEGCVADDLWTLPKYRELLFLR